MLRSAATTSAARAHLNDLVAAYIASGREITVCPPALSRANERPLLTLVPREPKPAAATPKAPAAPRAAKTDTRRITAIVANPKRPGSACHGRYNLYTEGMTVSTYLSLGGTLADIRWDAKQGFITLTA